MAWLYEENQKNLSDYTAYPLQRPFPSSQKKKNNNMIIKVWVPFASLRHDHFPSVWVSDWMNNDNRTMFWLQDWSRLLVLATWPIDNATYPLPKFPLTMSFLNNYYQNGSSSVCMWSQKPSDITAVLSINHTFSQLMNGKCYYYVHAFIT